MSTIPQDTREAIRRAHVDLREARQRAEAVTRPDGTDSGGHPGIIAANLEGYLGRYPIPLLNALEEAEARVRELEAENQRLRERAEKAEQQAAYWRERWNIATSGRSAPEPELIGPMGETYHREMGVLAQDMGKPLSGATDTKDED